MVLMLLQKLERHFKKNYMKKISINSKVKDGVLQTNRQFISDTIKTFEGKDVVITIEIRKKKRSNEQNAYYHAVIIPLCQDGFKNVFGEHFSATEVHDYLKSKFLFKELVNQNTGEIERFSKSTTENSTIEMEIYHDQIRAFALEFLGVNIPLPNENIQFSLNID